MIRQLNDNSFFVASMFRRIIMAGVNNTQGKAVISEKTNPATSTMGKKKAQIRTFSSKSSPVYKTQSDTSLVNGMKNLSLRDKTNSPSRPAPPRRGFFGGSGKATINNLSDVAGLIHGQHVKNVVIVAGAGISTPSGIPDFRTPGTGLYDNLQQYKIPYPEAIFDIDYFHHNPRPFFTLAKELYPSGKYRPNYIHYFARLLHDKGMLLRMYTQNIDGLERLAGIPPTKMVEAHGTFATATCVICSQKYNGEDIKENIFSDKLPRCKRTSCPGIVKPDIVFFGEELPKRFYYYLKDMLQTDMVLVMGTSLEVQPFAGIIDNVRWNIPRVLFNMKAVGPFRHNKRSKDIVAEGDLLETMQKFVGMIDWKIDMADLITKNEGEFKIGEDRIGNRSVTDPFPSERPPTSYAKPPPALEKINQTQASKSDQPYACMWRQQARLDLFRANFYFSSSESMSSSSETESSDEDDKKQKKPGLAKYNGRTNNSRIQTLKTDQPARKYGTNTSQRNQTVTEKKPPRGSWMKPASKQTDNIAAKPPSQTRVKPSPELRRKEGSLLQRPQSDSSRPVTRCSSRQKDRSTPSLEISNNESKSTKLASNVTNIVGQRTSSHDSLRKGPGAISTRPTQNRPPVQPSSKTRAATQQRLVERQKTLFRAGSAEVPRLTYRHRLQKSVYGGNSSYANESNSDSSSQTSSDDDDDDSR